MDKHGYFSGQTVKNTEMDALESAVEVADQMMLEAVSPADTGSLAAWPLKGFFPSVTGADRNVTVNGPGGGGSSFGLAVDALGNKHLVRMTGSGTIALAGIAVVTARYVTVLYRFYRNNSDPRRDDQNITANYDNPEGTAATPPVPPFGAALTSGGLDSGAGVSGGLVYVLGTDQASPPRPAIPADCIPVCDILLAPAYGNFASAQLDMSRCRPAWASYQAPGGAVPARAGGSIGGAVQDLMAATLDNCRVYPSEPNSQFVNVRSGRVNLDGVKMNVLLGLGSANTGTNTPGIGSGGGAALPAMTVPAAGNSKVYLIYADQSGIIQQAVGAAAATGAQVAPSHVGRIPLAEITVVGSGGGGANAVVTGSMIADVRPFLRSNKYNPNLLRLTGSVLTTIPLGFSYVVGQNQLMVYKNGLKLSKLAGAGNYIEVDDGAGLGTTITLGAALIVGDVLEVWAGAVADANPIPAIDYSALNATIAGTVRMYTTGNNAITIEPFGLIVDGRMVASPSAGFSLTGAVTGLTPGAIYYIYAYATGAVLSVEVVTTVPDPLTGRRTKTGDASRVYLGSIYIMAGAGGASGFVKAFRRVGRHTVWVNDLVNGGTGQVNPVNALDGSVAFLTGAGPANVVLTSYIPPWVNYADLEIYAPALGAGIPTLIGKGAQVTRAPIGVALVIAGPYPVSLDGAQSFTLQGSTVQQTFAFLHGYED